jgi:hypothetical protein
MYFWQRVEEYETPRKMYIDTVVNDFISNLYYHINPHEGTKEEDQDTFPLTFQDFCKNNCHLSVIQFFHKATSENLDAMTKFFSTVKKKDILE